MLSRVPVAQSVAEADMGTEFPIVTVGRASGSSNSTSVRMLWLWIRRRAILAIITAAGTLAGL